LALPFEPRTMAFEPRGMSADFTPGLALGSQASMPHPPLQPANTISPHTHRSMALLEADSHAIRLKMADKEQSGKATKAKYDRYLQAYQTWWDANQVQIVGSDMSRVAIPAFPITVTKVALFLDYEST
jgi:hypothetical protein